MMSTLHSNKSFETLLTPLLYFTITLRAVNIFYNSNHFRKKDDNLKILRDQLIRHTMRGLCKHYEISSLHQT